MTDADPTPAPEPTPPPSQPTGPAGPVRRANEVSVAAYTQMSFHDEVELSGHIGGAKFEASSHSSMRGIAVTGAIGPEAVELRVKRKRPRHPTVTGMVLGQPISGHLTTTNATLTFEGMAGLEPLRYHLKAQGSCTSHGADLGLKVVYQAIYTELTGSVDRIPDAVMISLLLPVAVVKWEAAYS